MQILIDTHVLLWWTILAHENRLSKKQLVILTDTQNEILLSFVSVWEMAIKQSIGKLKLPAPAVEFARFEAQDKNLQLLPLRLEHIGAYEKLPMAHRDPFDRLLAAQAKVEDVKFMTGDKNIEKLGVKRYW